MDPDTTSQLAIIIPAYKAEFLRETLDSLCGQTCKQFNVYIGDDCSPDDVYGIVSDYADKLNITYQRFDTNLGGKDLIAQWERCIKMSQHEEFFCLFSDDDVMMPQNVELFYKKLKCNDSAAADVYHFDIDIVDRDTKLRKRRRDFPEYLTADRFFRLLYLGVIDARMPEFIFRRRAFEGNGGFVHFDLAFRSDNATVMVNASARPMCSIKGSRVLWRDSGSNVSSKGNAALNERRVMASIKFFNWVEDFFRRKGEKFPLPLVPRIKTYVRELLLLWPGRSKAELHQLMERIDFFRNRPMMMRIGKIYMERKIFKKRFKI